MIHNTIEHIRRLEEQLLKPEVRSSPEKLGLLLAEDFLEIGSSGHTLDKSQIIATLKDGSEFDYSLQDFQVKQLSPDIALATYRLETRQEGGHGHQQGQGQWETPWEASRQRREYRGNLQAEAPRP